MRNNIALLLLALTAAAGGLGCARRVGVHYAFDLQRPEGELLHANAGFRSGDRFRLRILPEQDCYLYLLHQGTDGAFTLLFPLAEVESGNNFARAGGEVRIPSAGWYRFDVQAGVEKLYLLACAKNIAEVESLRNLESLDPNQVKAALKAVDDVYNLGAGRRLSRAEGLFQHELVKARAEYPVLKCEIDIEHE